MAEPPGEPRQSTGFMLLYALATAGGAVAYVPFITILLPIRVNLLAGTGEDVAWLGYIAFVGAVAASLGNIAFGWLSDVTGNRRGWTWAGLAGTCLLLPATSFASTLTALLALVIAWQLALNMMLAPIAAWGGDTVPDRQKGLLGGMLAFAPALGAMAGAIVTFPQLAGAEARLWLVALLVCLLVLPVLLFGRPKPMPHLMQETRLEEEREADSRGRLVVASMWLARLFVQIAYTALFAYLYLWFRSIDEGLRDSDVAQIFSLVLLVAVPLSLLIGRWSDRAGKPILPLIISAAVVALGMGAMAVARDPVTAVAGYVLFALAAMVFLALHSGQTLRVLPSPQRRGRDLGIFNLTNTLPSMIMPWLALALVPAFGFGALFAVLAAIAAAAAALLAFGARPGVRRAPAG